MIFGNEADGDLRGSMPKLKAQPGTITPESGSLSNMFVPKTLNPSPHGSTIQNTHDSGPGSPIIPQQFSLRTKVRLGGTYRGMYT